MFIKGKILSSYGVVGYAKIKSVSNSFNDFLNLKGNKIFLKKKNDTDYMETKVEDVKVRQNLLLMKFSQIDTPEKVKSLINYEIWVNDELASSLDSDEYYFGELIGFSIVNSHKEVLAEVISFIESGNSVLLEVKRYTKTFLLPFLDIYLGEINKNSRTIELKVLELLE